MQGSSSSGPLLAAGTAASGIGSILGAQSAQPTLTAIPPPAPVFGGLSSTYQGALMGAAPGAISSLGTTAQTGNPTDISNMFTQYLNQQKILTQMGQANVISGLGAQGLRYGSSTGDALSLYNAQSSGNFASTLANMLFQSNESAANRQVQASSILASLFSQAGTTTAPTAVVTAGAPSPTGSGLSSAGSGLSSIALLMGMGLI